jgi:hypothetical protein
VTAEHCSLAHDAIAAYPRLDVCPGCGEIVADVDPDRRERIAQRLDDALRPLPGADADDE